MWLFGGKGPSGFSKSSTAEEVTHGIDGTALTAIVTGPYFYLSSLFSISFSILPPFFLIYFCLMGVFI